MLVETCTIFGACVVSFKRRLYLTGGLRVACRTTLQQHLRFHEIRVFDVVWQRIPVTFFPAPPSFGCEDVASICFRGLASGLVCVLVFSC